MRWTKWVESWLRVKNRHGQPLSNQWWQDGGREDRKNEDRSKESEGGWRSQNIGKLWKRTPNKEVMKIGIKELTVGTGGQCRVERRSKLGKGGQLVGKWTGFSRLETASTRLFPHESMQVVDFPLLGWVRIFLDANFANERELGKDLEQKKTEIGRKRTQRTQKMGNSTDQTLVGGGRIRILHAITSPNRAAKCA